MSDYWQKREAEQKFKQQVKTEKEACRKLEKLYVQAAKDITKDMSLLYLTLLEEGEDTLMNNLYKYNRYFEMREMIKKELTKLGNKELKEIESSLKTMYYYSAQKTLKSINFQISNNKELKALMHSMWEANGANWSSKVWCADGLTGAERVAKHMSSLQQTLEKGMLDCVGRGASKDELVKTLMKRFDVGYSEASRLARTELTYIQNQATRDSYIKAGVEEYEYLAEIDDRTSEICEEMDGQIFKVANAIVGVNYPPLHPNCRSTTLAVID